LQRLADVSHPRVTVDTAGLDPRATLLANRLARRIGELDGATLDKLIKAIEPKKHR
jgi:hypothetical protein